MSQVTLNSRQIHCSICFDTLVPAKVSSERFEVTAKDHQVTCIQKCSHLFHQSCITPWLEKNDSCPNCRSLEGRANLVKFDDFIALYTQYLNGEIEKSDLKPPPSSTHVFKELKAAPLPHLNLGERAFNFEEFIRQNRHLFIQENILELPRLELSPIRHIQFELRHPHNYQYYYNPPQSTNNYFNWIGLAAIIIYSIYKTARNKPPPQTHTWINPPIFLTR